MVRSVEIEKGFTEPLRDRGCSCLPAVIRKALYDGAPENMTGTLLFIPKGEETEGMWAIEALCQCAEAVGRKQDRAGEVNGWADRVAKARAGLGYLQRELSDYRRRDKLHQEAARAELALRDEGRVVEVRDRDAAGVGAGSFVYIHLGGRFLCSTYRDRGLAPGFYTLTGPLPDKEPEKVRVVRSAERNGRWCFVCESCGDWCTQQGPKPPPTCCGCGKPWGEPRDLPDST